MSDVCVVVRRVETRLEPTVIGHRGQRDGFDFEKHIRCAPDPWTQYVQCKRTYVCIYVYTSAPNLDITLIKYSYYIMCIKRI